MYITNGLGRNHGKFARRFEISDPWADEARLYGKRLKEMLGEKDFDLWAEIIWPGDTVDSLPKKELADEFRSALALGKDELIDYLECGCTKPDQHCIVCCAQARITARVEDLL